MRFSLLTAVLVLTNAVLSVSHWKLMRENRELKASIDYRLNDSIEVHDKSATYVKESVHHELTAWIYRVYHPPRPENKRHRLKPGFNRNGRSPFSG